MSDIKQTYQGIVIIYDEAENVWRFTLRNRDRHTASLVQAREAIDRPVSKSTANGFQPVRGWRVQYDGSRIALGTVTSISESRYGSAQVWFTPDKRENVLSPKRERISVREFFPNTLENADAVKCIERINEAREALQVQRDGCYAKLKAIQVPEEKE